MTHRAWIVLSVFALVAGCCASGCVYTVAGNKLPAISPPQPAFRPSVEHTVGDYSFSLDGGKMITSNYAGRMVNGDVMAAWKDRGYISSEKYVESGGFSRNADYNVTLSGTQYGESSIGLQILSGLTLFLLPYTVTQHYDVHYSLEDGARATRYTASVQESEEEYVELFLLFALPWAQHGHRDTMQRIGDHLYDQLYRAGAFQARN